MVSTFKTKTLRSTAEFRRQKAMKILTVLRSHFGDDLRDLKCLDVGCSSGIISNVLAKHFGQLVAVDVDSNALARAASRRRPNESIVMADATRLPLASDSFDVVVCAQVYEHVANPAWLLGEIHRVLAPGGACFFSGPNRLAPIEAHYSLPFVHWLPKPIADCYLRIMGKAASYEEKPLFYWQLKALVRAFDRVDYTAKMIKAPATYHCQEEVKPGWLSKIPEQLLTKLAPFSPNYNWILCKKDGRCKCGQ